MKKHPCSSAEFICQYGIKSLQRLANFNLTIRPVALMIICALLSPVFLFNPIRKTAAQARLSSPVAAPVSAAPQPFILLNNNTAPGFGIISVISTANEAVFGFFAASSLPEGFEMAKPASAFSTFITPVAAFFGFGAKQIETVPAPPSAPLPPRGSVSFDFDNDGRADVSRWRRSSYEWSVKSSLDDSITNYNLGSGSSAIVPADYDGDGRTDFAVFNASTGEWTIRESAEDKNVSIANFGHSGDNPVVGDYDGDRLADAAIFRPSNRTWYVRQSGNDGTVVSTEFGIPGDIPVPGNYDGDSQMDYAVYRPSTGDWHILFSSSGAYTQFHWGISTDIPTPADYDGDNKTDLAVYRGSTGTWYAYKSSGSGQYITQTWGNYGDQPVPADYDGDGKAEFAVWRPSTSTWHFYKSCNYDNSCGNNAPYEYAQFGINGDVPTPASYLKQIGSSIQGYDLAKARFSPKNATGGTDLYSRNFSWGTGLISLPGRAGLNAGFGMSYNSLVWTKQGSNIYFDTDNSNISPGFRFGFPVIEPIYYDNTGSRTFNYLMVSPSGARVQFRQVNGASGTYETADSSYTQLKTTGASSPNEPVENVIITVTGTDGTKMTFRWKAGAFRCSEIKDRNGNFITVNHDEYGLLRTVTDTLGRVITVNYDSELYPTSITQDWKNNNGQGTNVTYTWATFTYGTQEITTNFNATEITNVSGPPNETILKVLKKVTYPDNTSTQFEYNSYGQVWQVINYAADSPTHLLNQVRTDLQNPANGQTDCPRFTKTYTQVENFNNNQEIVIHNEVIPNRTYSVGGQSGPATLVKVWMENHPYGAVSKTYVGASGWQESLPLATEDWVTENGSEARKRWTWTNWTQDNPNLSYILNPRITESKVGDTTNIKKTTVEYYPVSQGSPVALYGLVKKVQVFDDVTGTLVKEAATEYNFDTHYISRRIIGLPYKTEISGLNQANNTFELVSKVTYAYDGFDFSDTSLEQNIPNVIQHDNTNYSASFVTGRGNLTGTTRHDVTGATSSVTSSIKYNTAGAPVAQINPLGRTVKISYADKFNDEINNRGTYAYPTKLIEVANTDADNNFSQIIYRFDTGANVWARSPMPVGNTAGKVTTREFDTLGRLLKEIVVNTGAYKRYEYPNNSVQAKSYTTIINEDGDNDLQEDEVLSESWTDGAGRILRLRTAHPNSSSGWSGSLVEYDILGRIKRSTVPTEISVNPGTNDWTPAGDDSAGWKWNSQEYDWKGRTTRIIPSDSNGTDGKDKLFSYEGCGCAGGEIVTVRSELVPAAGQSISARRTQKFYSDILSRQNKTVVMEWNGTTPYTTSVNTFNGRDQITLTQQYAGDESGAWRGVTLTYDGHGRMKTRQYPIEGANTTWNYNADDSLQMVIDPRGVITNFDYDSRGLLHKISYDLPDPNPTSIPGTADVTYTYDALGNRKQMTDGTGTTTYAYNQLSQMTSETKTITELSSSYTVNYEYNLSGGLRSISDPFDVNRKFVYSHDKSGRVTGTAETAQNVTHQYIYNTEYRAWGAMKKYRHDDGTSSFINPVDISFSYDAALRVSEYDIKNSQGVGVGGMEFQRHADGKLYYAREKSYPNGASAKRWLDRSYGYDQVGRLQYALSGYDANEIPGMTAGPYKQLFTYNAFSEVTQISGKHWQIPLSPYAKTYTNGREDSSSYDAAGKMTLDPIGSVVNPKNRTFKFDAAGRQVQMFDPSLNVNDPAETYNYTYDGNGWQVKDERATSTQTEQYYKIRSTVMGGEEVGSMRIYNNIIQYSSSVPTHNGKIIHSYLEGGSTAYQWTAPEGLRGYGGALQGQEFDTRGADAGLGAESSNVTGGGSGYPGYSDADNYARCSDEGVPLPCQKLGSIVEHNVYQLVVSGLITSPVHNSRPGEPPSKATAHASTQNSAVAQATTTTAKPEDDPHIGSTIETSSIPGEDGEVNLAKREVTVRYYTDVTFRETSQRSSDLNGKFTVFMTDEKEISNKIKEVTSYAMSQEACTKAFEAIGAIPIQDQLGSVTFVTERVFTEPLYDANWTKNSDVGNEMRKGFKAKPTTNDLSWIGTYGETGHRFIGVTKRAVDEKDDWFDVVVIHSFVHSGGVGGKSIGYFGRTAKDMLLTGYVPPDLHYLGKLYDDVIKHCTKTGSKQPKAEPYGK
jgi:YD repeat-containing protein